MAATTRCFGEAEIAHRRRGDVGVDALPRDEETHALNHAPILDGGHDGPQRGARAAVGWRGEQAHGVRRKHGARPTLG